MSIPKPYHTWRAHDRPDRRGRELWRDIRRPLLALSTEDLAERNREVVALSLTKASSREGARDWLAKVRNAPTDRGELKGQADCGQPWTYHTSQELPHAPIELDAESQERLHKTLVGYLFRKRRDDLVGRVVLCSLLDIPDTEGATSDLLPVREHVPLLDRLLCNQLPQTPVRASPPYPFVLPALIVASHASASRPYPLVTVTPLVPTSLLRGASAARPPCCE